MRTISRVIWSPHSLTRGMEMSSMKQSMRLLLGGPKVLPWRFSTDDSIWRWKMEGVVACENDIFLKVTLIGSTAWSTERMIDVLAVPGPPTRMTARFCEMERPMLYSQRTESIVGMSSDANCLPS